MSARKPRLAALLVLIGILVACSDDDGQELSERREYCEAMSAAFFTASGGTVSLIGEAQQNEAERAFEQLAEDAPDVPQEIRSEWDTFVSVMREWFDAVADLDLESGETPDDQGLNAVSELGARFRDSDFQAASDRIQDWFVETCDIEPR